MLNKSSLSRIWQKTQDHSCGIISGYRDENDKSKNQKNNREIMAYLMKKGYSVTKVKGAYVENKGEKDEKEVSEPSLFVCNQEVDGDDKGALEADLKKLGKAYDQDSVLIIPVGGKKAYLVGTTKRKNDFLPYGQKMVVGSSSFGGAKGEFYSKVNNRQFTYESTISINSMSDRWVNKVLAERAEDKLNML